ncbi:hypothetical protein ACJ8NA_12555 [Pseudomonas azerbaijanorientalis]|uniref:Uncharacterized protein n=1 Tax=Pseudomonas azerbaijanorientalis TaxID=2842350 RepID=A0ABW8W2H2_9PSED
MTPDWTKALFASRTAIIAQGAFPRFPYQRLVVAFVIGQGQILHPALLVGGGDEFRLEQRRQFWHGIGGGSARGRIGLLDLGFDRRTRGVAVHAIGEKAAGALNDSTIDKLCVIFDSAPEDRLKALAPT